MSALDRLDELKNAATDWFSKEKKRLQAEYDFLDAISKKRGSGAKIQEQNAAGASTILANSINDYLSKPLTPQDEN